MYKNLGYILAFVGLAVMAVGFGTFKLDLAILKVLKPGVITIIGVVLIAVGVFMALKMGKNTKQAGAEVPIYEGEKIVGYRRG
jgi:hypothetical protein